MSAPCVLSVLLHNRYKNFLGLNNPNDFMAAAAQMKAQGDFTSLRNDATTIAAVRAAGMPADKVLSVNTVEEAQQAARWVVFVGGLGLCYLCLRLS
jgi:hypothetical protein